MTERLYYTDSYLSYFKARVVDSDQSAKLVYLDRTAFYPTSGGQPYDLGVISGQPVLDVIDEGDRIAHRTAAPVDADTVECHVDWERRADHMQQHTGQHVLSGVWLELFSIPTVSFHMGAELSTIEIETSEVDQAQIERVEQRVNQITRENRAVSISFDISSTSAGLRKPSARTGPLRIITIDGLDRSACGGTHVSTTGEVSPVQVRRSEKIRGNIRLEFVCGERAGRRTRSDYRILSELSRINAIAIDDLPTATEKIRARLSEAEKERARLSNEIGQLEGSNLYTSALPDEDGIRRVNLEVPVIDDMVRSKAQTFASRARSVALVAGINHPGILIACSGDTYLNAGVILRNALAEVGGRGGGSATFAQGNLSDPRAIARIRHTLGFRS